MSSSPLFSLPPELLDAVVSLLPPPSLARLARVCHALQEVVEPRLYHTVSLQNTQDKPFTNAIDNNSARAGFVRELLIHYHVDIDEEDEDEEQEQECYLMSAQALSPTIARLQNLESLIVKGFDEDPIPLGLEPSMDKSARFQNLFQQAAMPHSQVLQSLRTCTLNLHECQIWELAHFDALFLHPTLQHLTLVNARMASFTSFDAARARSTDLQELTLMSCDINPLQLDKILHMPKALQCFTTKGSAWQGRIVSGENRAANLASLRMHASSLVFLDLDFYLDDEQPPREPLAFVDFPVLRQLAIELWILRGHIEKGILSQKSLLPQSLEVLTLKCAVQHVELESYYLDPVYQWLQEGVLPSLREITLEVTLPIPNVPDEAFRGGQTVREAFEKKGVKVSMMEELPGGYVPFECDCCQYRYRNPGLGTALPRLYNIFP